MENGDLIFLFLVCELMVTWSWESVGWFKF